MFLCPLGADEIEIREAEPRDAADIARLLDDHGRATGRGRSVTVDEVAHWLELEAYVMWIALLDGLLVAYADADERPGRERYWVDLRCLDRRAATALVEALEAWAGRRAAPGAAVIVAQTEGDKEAAAALEGAGFRIVRYELEMRIDLTEEPPPPDWPEGLSVRTFRPGEDEQEAWSVDSDAFADHWEYIPDSLENWRAEVVEHPDFDPSLVFLPTEGDAVAGLAVCLLRDLDGPIGWVDILGVRRRWRGRGLASALLRHSFRELRARGAAWAGLEVDAENLTGAVRLYERAGMRPVNRMALWRKEIDLG